jgi:predicted membrane protein
MEYLVGIILGLVIATVAKITGFDKDRSFYPVILVVIAMYYVLFAIMSGQSDTIVTEIIVALLFLVLAVIGACMSAMFIAAGLIAHGLYDLIHNQLVVNTGVPIWWPGFCAAVDFVLGIVVLLLVKVRSNGRLQD